MAAVIAACVALVLLAAATALLRRVLAGRRELAAGAILGGVILYVVLGYAYALLTADPVPEGPSDCPGPPYSTC